LSRGREKSRTLTLTSSRLPIPLQAAFIRKALAAGKHVLSEKPIAADVATASELVRWYREEHVHTKATWSVAENFRFLESFQYGAEQVATMGRLLGFQIQIHKATKADGKYYRMRRLGYRGY
jgi:predicted dehydrogenase